MDIPEEPVLFFKASSAFCGPNDDLVLPRGGDKTDWEVELAFVVGKRASYVDEERRNGSFGRVTPCITTTASVPFNWKEAVSG
jgi:2-keto-4-pentenoate hydratase/2-oxohepta-3-ene-1,7-dioic acid hydratase in catechol pathway